MSRPVDFFQIAGRALALACLLAFAACQGDSLTPTSAGGEIPEVTGTYSSPSFWKLRLTRSSDGTFVTFECSGRITVETQDGPLFSGSFRITRPCEATAEGSIRNGTVSSDGAVSFGYEVPGQSLSALEQMSGCDVSSGGDVFRGSIVAGELTAALEAVAECPDEGRVEARLEVRGSR